MGDAPTCLHCGLANRVRRKTTARPADTGGAGSFCCLGCELAWHLSGRELEGGGRTDRLLARILVCAFLAMGVMVFSLAGYGSLFEGGDPAERASEAARALAGLQRLAALLLALPIVHLLGLPLLAAVWRGRRWLSADGLIVIGTAAALGLSLWSTATGRGHAYYETVAMVLVLVGLGRWIDAGAKERARAHLRAAAEESVPAARRLVAEDGGEREEEVAAEALAPGDRVRVRPGEPVPVDGLVIGGRAFADTALLTGESEPRALGPGDRVLAGAVPLDGYLDVEARATVGARVRDEVERLLEEALSRRGEHVRLADRLAGALVPLVGAAALATFAYHAWRSGPERGLLNALSLVLISCPCALGIATPLAFWTALSAAWRRGILVRGADVLERLARARRVVFDKTGTLTLPDLELVRVEPLGSAPAEELLELAASLEGGSEHPIADALRRARPDARARLEEFEVLPGRGVRGRVDGRALELVRCDGSDESSPHTVVELRVEGAAVGRFHLAGELDPGAERALASLRLAGLAPSVLTGDAAGPARWVAERLRVPVEHSLLPADKVERVRAAGARGTIYVGDGLNDVAALATADVGIAVAGASPRSIDVADVTLLSGGVGAVPDLLRLARRAVGTARGNLAWAFAYNVLGWSLAATGRLTPVFAALAMVLSSAAVVLNSTRAGGPATSAGGSSARAPRTDG